VLHLINHALMKGVLFMALGAFAISYGVRRIENCKGLGMMMPMTASAFTLGALSLIGVPFTVGFISKFYLIQAALAQGWIFAVAAILISSVLAVFYCYRILVNLWVTPIPEGRRDLAQPTPYLILVPLVGLALANLVFGVHAAPLVDIAETAAAAAINAGTGS